MPCYQEQALPSLVGQMKALPTYLVLISTNTFHLTPDLYFTATSNPLFRNTIVFLYILDSTYVFFSGQNSILRYVQLKRKAQIKSLQILKPSYIHPGKLFDCFLYAIIASYISSKKLCFVYEVAYIMIHLFIFLSKLTLATMQKVFEVITFHIS